MDLRLVRRAILFGAALALVTRSGHRFPGDFDWLPRVGVPWLAVAFAAAVGVPRVRHGAALGALSLVAAILVYYATLAYQGWYASSPLGLGWLVVAVPGGALFGTLGSLWSAGRARVPIAAVLSGCFAGEALLFNQFADPAATPYLMAAGVVIPLLLLRRPLERVCALALAVPFVAAAVVAEGVVFLTTAYLSA